MDERTKRRSINIDGAVHASPIPSACRIGNVLMTGNVYGRLPTGEIDPDPQAQVRTLFANLEEILHAGGATFDDVIKLSINVTSLEIRKLINHEWLRRFPDPESRPARSVARHDYLTPPAVIQCEAIAIIGGRSTDQA